MTPFRLFSSVGLLVWLAGGLQQGLANKISILGYAPNFVFLVAAILGLLLPSLNSLVCGCVLGIVLGAITGANMWQFVVATLLTSWLANLTIELRFQRNWAIAGLVTFITSLVSTFVLSLLTARGNFGEVLAATIISAVYNGVLALLVFVPIEKLVGIHND